MANEQPGGQYGQPIELNLKADVNIGDDLGHVKRYDDMTFSLNSGYFRNGGNVNMRMYTDTTSGEKVRRCFTSNGNQVSYDGSAFTLYKGNDSSPITIGYTFPGCVKHKNNKQLLDVFMDKNQSFLGLMGQNKVIGQSLKNINLISFTYDQIDESLEYTTEYQFSIQSSFTINHTLPRRVLMQPGTPAGTQHGCCSYLLASDFTDGTKLGIFYLSVYSTGASNQGVDLIYYRAGSEYTVATNLPWTPNAQITVYNPTQGTSYENLIVLYHAGDTNSGVVYYCTNATSATPTFTNYVVPSSGIPRYLYNRGCNIQLFYESIGGTGVVNISWTNPSGLTFTAQSPQGTTTFATTTQNNYCNPFGVHGICSATVGGTLYNKVPFANISFRPDFLGWTDLDQYYLYCSTTNNNSKNPDVSSSSAFIAEFNLSCKTLNGSPVLYTITSPSDANQNYYEPKDPGNPLNEYGDIFQHYNPIILQNYTNQDTTPKYFILKGSKGDFNFYRVKFTSDFAEATSDLEPREIFPGVLLFNIVGSYCIIDTNKGTLEQNLGGLVTSTIYPVTKTGGTVTGNLQFSVYNEYTNAVNTGLRPEGTNLSAQVVDIMSFDRIMNGYMFLSNQITSSNGGKILMDDNNILTAFSYTSPRVLKQQTPASWFTLTYTYDNRLPVPIASTGDYFNGGIKFNATEGAILEENYIGWQLANLISQPIDSFFRLFGYRYLSDGSKIYSIELSGVDNGTVTGITLLAQANRMTFMCASSTKAYFKGMQNRLFSFDGGRNLDLYLDYNNLSTDSTTNSMDLEHDDILAGLYLSSTNELVWLTSRGTNKIGLMYDRGGNLTTYDFSGLNSGLGVYNLKNYGDVAVIEALKAYNIAETYYNTYAFLSYDLSNTYPKFNTVNTTYDTFDGSTLKIQTSYLGLGEWKRQRVNRIVIRGMGGSSGHYQINQMTEDGIYYGTVKNFTPTYGANAENYFVVDIIPDKPSCLAMQLKISFWRATESVPQKAVDTTIFGITYFVVSEADLQTINHVV